MERAVGVRVAGLYVPIALAVIAGMGRKQPVRQFAACLLSVLWVLPSLLLLERLNEWAQWWSFASDGPVLVGMPLELYLGWAVLWGALPQLVWPRLSLWLVAGAMALMDVVAMPWMKPVLMLGPHWMFGEAVAVGLVLLPSLAIARWTLEETHLRARAAIQIVTAGLIFLYLGPELVFVVRLAAGWQPLFQIGRPLEQCWLQIALMAAIPGVSAVLEFAERGGGTPIPYDPPRRLVTSGVYRYCSNPMQVSCSLVMLLWAGVLSNAWLLLPALVSVVYCVGLAAWDEGADLSQRFGAEWQEYRREVGVWRVRWRPFHAGAPATVYIAATCGPCREVRAWLEARTPIGLRIVDAEELPQGSIHRMRYEPGDGSASVDGVRALARALEHLSAGWAFAGAALRLPVVWRVAQALMDGSGLGPRTVESRVNSSCER